MSMLSCPHESGCQPTLRNGGYPRNPGIAKARPERAPGFGRGACGRGGANRLRHAGAAPDHPWPDDVRAVSGGTQLAIAAGARVTAVVDTRHVELGHKLGAERVIDYTSENFTRIGETFDGLFDAVGKTTYLRCRRLLKPEAMFVGTDMGPYG